ncbi:MAG: SDR family oxidoreductase [Marinomonas sp.]
MDINNKVIVITGAARGLGLAMAEYLADKGAKIALVDMDFESVNHASSTITDSKGYVCNVANESEVEQVFEQIKNDFSRIDGLVNNAGILKDGLLIKYKNGEMNKMSLDQFQSVIDVNLSGVFLCGREAASHMVKSGQGGVIVNISSISRAGNFGQTNYSAAKAGVVAMTTAWAQELAKFDIRTGAIAPGFIETEMTAQMPQKAYDMAAQMSPLKRMGTPQEIAQAVSFIFENDFISGRVIEVDGGTRI